MDESKKTFVRRMEKGKLTANQQNLLLSMRSESLLTTEPLVRQEVKLFETTGDGAFGLTTFNSLHGAALVVFLLQEVHLRVSSVQTYEQRRNNKEHPVSQATKAFNQADSNLPSTDPVREQTNASFMTPIGQTTPANPASASRARATDSHFLSASNASYTDSQIREGLETVMR